MACSGVNFTKITSTCGRVVNSDGTCFKSYGSNWAVRMISRASILTLTTSVLHLSLQLWNLYIIKFFLTQIRPYSTKYFKNEMVYKYLKRQHLINAISTSPERVSSSEPRCHFTGQEPSTETVGSGVPGGGGLGCSNLPTRNSEGPPKSCQTQPDCENC